MVGKNILEHPNTSGWRMDAPSSEELNLLDSSQVHNYLEEKKPDLVIHAAGRVGGIQDNIRNPISYLDDNLTIGRNVVMAAYHNRVGSFLNIGSTCMYPVGLESPLREEMILSGKLEQTNEAYALAKIATARLCQYIARQNPDMAYKSLVGCNLYGRHDKFGKDRSHLIAAVIDKIHKAKNKGRSAVEIWGDGTALREFMYAGDFADAVVRAASDIHKIPALMNIGGGRDYSVTHYYKLVAEVLEWNGSFDYVPSQPTGVRRKLASIDRQLEWGWQPSTSLVEGIRKTYEFYCSVYASNDAKKHNLGRTAAAED